MATLRYSQIRSTPGSTIHYIANRDKILSSKIHDIYNVLNYMGEPESTERVFSFARHCSANPDLAEKEISLHRARYFENKKGGIQGLKNGNAELLGLHFYLSYTVNDSPKEYLMNTIAMKIVSHPLLKDFAVFGANHFDKEHKHTHFFVSAYSAEGKPRKLCLRKGDYNEIRKYANKLCYEHGLSFIDLSTLRWKDPEYSSWVDEVIAEGKVVVHSEKEEHKKVKKQKTSTRGLYYRKMKEAEEAVAKEYTQMTEKQRARKDNEDKYYYSVYGDQGKVRYVSDGNGKRFYAIPRRDKDGSIRTPLELAVRYIVVVLREEGNYIRRKDSITWLNFHVEVAKDIQNLYDWMSTAREMHVDSPHDIAGRIIDVGKQMNALKKERARHADSLRKHDEIIAAYMTYMDAKDRVEVSQAPEKDDLEVCHAAYAILAENSIFTEEDYRELYRRRNFEKRKIDDYDRRMPELNKQYRDLKRLEAIAANPPKLLDEIFGYSSLARQRDEERKREIARIKRKRETDMVR